MDPLHDALARFMPHDDTEARDVARLLAAIDHGDVWARDAALHATASALVVHPPTGRVLLRHHARMDGWFQVGGHGDPGETDPWAIARREAEEETGLTDLTDLSPAPGRRPLQVVIVPVPAAEGEPGHEHADVRYVFATGRPEEARAESPGTPVRWFSFAEARAVVAEPNLRTFLDRIEACLKS